eukprot:CAMPEP_0118952422 /NCGR_PEP_ID=MMETSP1169-20130426/54831_1 /TAXON_ID=36882 /ORGANISM="Pyramimonas obovata, Strain CCMP722" /LENGTH=546 /DNA_ID=CAMNT_0006899675 /DNA_START=40 /DNA_END=1680 /DNA_ORIENTATION=-
MSPRCHIEGRACALAFLLCVASIGVNGEEPLPEPTEDSAHVREIAGAPLTVISHGLTSSTIGCETTLKKNDVHMYTYLRKQRSELGFVWNSVRVQLTEMHETSCPLELVVVEPRVGPDGSASNHSIEGRRDKKSKMSEIETSPFGEPLSIRVQCKRSAFGLLEARHGAWYNLTISNGFCWQGPAMIATGLAVLAVAPYINASVSAFYVGGITLSFMLLSIIVLFQISKRIPGGQKASGLFFLVYWRLPQEWKDATTHQYLHYITWPFKQIWTYAQHGGYEMNDHLAVGAAVLLLWASALLGYFSVRRFAINKETGLVEQSAADFVLWTLRGGALLLMFFGASKDSQVCTAITAAVAAVMIPPGSWIVAGILRSAVFTVRVLVYPFRLTLRLLWWLCPLRLFLRGRRATPRPVDEEYLHEQEEWEDEPEPPSTPTMPMSPRVREDGSALDDPEYLTPARPRVTTSAPPKGFAAAMHRRWLTAEEVKRQSEATTAAQLAALHQSPQFAAWMTKNHRNLGTPNQRARYRASSDEEDDDDIRGVNFGSGR